MSEEEKKSMCPDDSACAPSNGVSDEHRWVVTKVTTKKAELKCKICYSIIVASMGVNT